MTITMKIKIEWFVISLDSFKKSLIVNILHGVVKISFQKSYFIKNTIYGTLFIIWLFYVYITYICKYEFGHYYLLPLEAWQITMVKEINSSNKEITKHYLIYIYVYIYTHTQIHIYVYICIHTYIYTHTHTHTFLV